MHVVRYRSTLTHSGANMWSKVRPLRLKVITNPLGVIDQDPIDASLNE